MENMHEPKYKLKIGNKRAESPYKRLVNRSPNLQEEGNGSTYPVAMARHHIIPYNTLREFYNNVVDNGEIKEGATFFEKLIKKINLIPGINFGYGKALEFVNIISRRGIEHSDDGKYPDGYDDLISAYTWMPGNLFIGPEGGKRSDDPENNFEENSRYIINAKHFRYLESLNREMRNYRKGNPRNIFGDLNSFLDKNYNIRKLNSLQWERRKGRRAPYKISQIPIR